MVELVDTSDLGSDALQRGGSSPFTRTKESFGNAGGRIEFAGGFPSASANFERKYAWARSGISFEPPCSCIRIFVNGSTASPDRCLPGSGRAKSFGRIFQSLILRLDCPHRLSPGLSGRMHIGRNPLPADLGRGIEAIFGRIFVLVLLESFSRANSALPPNLSRSTCNASIAFS